MSEQARARLLIVHPETDIQRAFEQRLRGRGYDVATAANGEEALGWLMQRAFELVLIEPALPARNCGEIRDAFARGKFESGKGRERQALQS